MEQKLKQHLDKLHAFDDERRAWLFLSSFVILTVLGIIFTWDAIIHSKIIWLLASAGLILSVTWWYWTMRLVRHLLDSKQDEYQLLSDIVKMVKEVKENVKTLGHHNVDNSK